MEKKAKTTAVKKPVASKAAAPAVKKSAGKYFFAIGRRKTAHARVKLYPEGTGEITVNERPFLAYFPSIGMQKSVTDPLTVLGLEKKINVMARANGGGVAAQADAVSLGISRALLLLDPNNRLVLKKSGFLARDARKKERKKPGLKRARRAPQWQKR